MVAQVIHGQNDKDKVCVWCMHMTRNVLCISNYSTALPNECASFIIAYNITRTTTSSLISTWDGCIIVEATVNHKHENNRKHVYV